MRVDMVPGGTYDLVSNEEMHGHIQGIQAKMTEYIRQEVQGVKPVRFQSNAFQPGVASWTLGTPPPRAGYVWSVMRALLASDLTAGVFFLFRTNDPTNVSFGAGANPDPSSIRYMISSMPNGANVALQFSKGQLLLQAGESLVIGTNTAGTIGHSYVLNVDAIEVPAEMVGKLLI